MKEPNQSVFWQRAVGLFALAYAALFIATSSVVVAGQRYFLLFDDEMISMSYARSLAHGHGLVWFEGAERVQGYSNFLWTLCMAAVQLVPLPLRLSSLPIQVLGAFAVASCALGTARLHGLISAHGGWASLLPCVWVGMYYPLHVWANLGVEAGVLAALSVWAAVWSIEAARGHVDHADHRLRVALLLGAGVLMRLDFWVYALPVAAFLMVRQRKTGVLAAAVPLAATLCLLAFQKLYYGDWFPNTAALKLGVPYGVRLERGWLVIQTFLDHFSYGYFVLALFGLLVSRAMQHAERLMLLAMIALGVAYTVYVGGDAWEHGVHTNRFLLPAWPVLMVALALGAEQLIAFIRSTTWRVLVAVIFGFVVLFRVNVGSPSSGRVEQRMLEWSLQTQSFARADHDVNMLKAGLFLNAAMREPLKVAVSSAGIAPYFADKGRFIDVLGKSDRVIAAQAPRPVAFLPGHVKWDLVHSVQTLGAEGGIGTWAGLPKHFPPGSLHVPARYVISVHRDAVSKLRAPSQLCAAFQTYELGVADCRSWLGQ